jgi:hypothetical protein
MKRPPAGDSGAAESSLHEILELLSSGEPSDSLCVLCTLRLRSTLQALRAFFREFVNDPALRAELRAAGGFCPAHSDLIASTGDALGTAIVYADLAAALRERFESRSFAGRRPGAARRAGAGDLCPACFWESRADARYSSALAAGLGSEVVRQAIEREVPLCSAHLEAVASAAEPADAGWLGRAASAALERLQAELQEIVRKSDYRFRGEPWGEERDAWRRALQRIRRGR